MTSREPYLASLEKYRDHCINAVQKAQDSYDKTIVSLSAGGLGVSLVYLKDVVGVHPIVDPGFLWGAWVSWCISIISVLLSFYFSQKSLILAIQQVDSGAIHLENPGGKFAKVTSALNAVAGSGFLLGVLWLLIFVFKNLGEISGH